MMKGKQVEVAVVMPPEYRKLLDHLATVNEWSNSQVVRKALRVLADVAVLHEATQAKLGDELGSIHRRLVDEFGEGKMLNKCPEYIGFDDGSQGLRIDGFIFYWSRKEPGQLLAVKHDDDREERFVVRGGELVLSGASPLGEGHIAPMAPLGDPSLN